MAQPLVVHEWGTFTSLQDETGRSIGYLNSNDEPLPPFVHRLQRGLITGAGSWDDSKSIPASHPDVIMRLETPVIYFHPQDKTKPFNIDVTATFNGGVLSEFYPYGRYHIKGGYPAPAGLDVISPNMHGSLTWKSLRVGGEVTMPQTKEHVWLAPRQVDSAPVAAGKEGEQYVFYRGVGNVPAPVTITRNGKGDVIPTPADPKWRLPYWLAEFRADGTCAYRQLAQQIREDRFAETPPPTGVFSDADFSADRVKELRAELHRALLNDGLFEDEAEAMLNTWHRSYFQGVGQRVFFLVPREWTDRMLPLQFSMPVDLKRVMIGRIELITPQQKQMLANLTDPKSFQSLGRFGYAMLLDEMKHRPTAALQKFAKDNLIRAFTAPKPAATQPVARAQLKAQP
jgi:hypothetical protein